MYSTNKKIVPLFLLALIGIHLQVAAQRNNDFWTAVNSSAWQPNKLAGNHPVFVPQSYKTFHLAEDAFKRALTTVPLAKNIAVSKSSFIISVPNAKGEQEHFRIVESPVMSAALAAKYPQLKSYAGQGIDDPSATIRFDITPKGFHAMILSGTRKTIYINPAR